MGTLPEYDYVIAGAGAAGLSLLTRMIRSGKFSDKKILLADRAPKTRNDRTWCFWEMGEGYFESIVYKSWQQLHFHSSTHSKLFDTAPYRYKMIRGVDFYEHCFRIIAAQKNVTVEWGDITDMDSGNGNTWLAVNGRRITAEFIFSSIVPPLVPEKGKHYLQQHFKGWIVETETPVFNAEEATLMDFRVSQQQGTTFVYVMPFSPTRALIEYTLFTRDLLEQSQYDDGLRQYIHDHLKVNYRITETEFGVIPMTNHRFPARRSNIIYLGTAGGQTKPSSGYTFRFIQKQAEALLQSLADGSVAYLPAPSGKYHFYDSVLLNVLATCKASGAAVFSDLFARNPTSRIFRFLDNESTLSEDISLISTLPVWPFMKAGIQELL